ncbi:MAG: putative bifunctional diguanylate cyclase/phosphodiesterase, partial [Wenzhouxiangellaceae bacterium]
RLMFRELLDQTIADLAGGSGRLGLLFIDLDDFKRINDTLGHDSGDAVLAEFAERLRRVLSGVEEADLEIKPIVARLGGDEFVALLSGRDIRARCEYLARRILENLAAPFEVAGQAFFLSSSIGITLFPDDARSSRHLLKCGDLAMYQAKLEGKNGVAWYRDHLTATAEERLQLEQDLRIALQQDQVAVVYHPVVSMADGQVIGAEALLRWRHPVLGDIPPERFVAVAESSALINDLGHFVMLRACRDAAEWQRVQPGLRVGVNVSARQLLRRDLFSQVEEVLRETGLPADCLTLELTESSLLHDRALTAETLARLHARGTNVWLDDFGTGFSGLSHLRQLRVRGVKIDRSFIADILDDPDDLALTSAIIAMAHSIGMRVVAEGVENTRQWGLLAERGCDFAQGFLLAPPLPADQVPAFRPDPSLISAQRAGASGSGRSVF